MATQKFSSDKQANDQWKVMQTSVDDLREFAYDWANKEGKSREFLKSVFGVNPDKQYKWWDDLVVKVETKLIEILDTTGLPPLKKTNYKVIQFDAKGDKVSFDFKDDLNEAKSWAARLYSEVNGGLKTYTFDNVRPEDFNDQFNKNSIAVTYINTGNGVRIIKEEVEI